MKKTIYFSLMIIFLFLLALNSTVFAGYSDKVENQSRTTESQYFTNLININDSISSYSNAENLYNSNNSLIVVEYNDLANTDFQKVTNKIVNENYHVIIGYTTLEDALSTYPLYGIDVTRLSRLIDSKPEYIENYKTNGYMKLFVEDGLLTAGRFFTTAKTVENILKNYNISNNNLSYDIVENSIQINEIASRATSGNYVLRFFDSSSTVFNKVYTNPNKDGTRITSLYRGEAVQDLDTVATRTYSDSYGGVYVEDYRKVQAVTPSGSYQVGYFYDTRTYDPRNGEEGFIDDSYWYNYLEPLYTYLDWNYKHDMYDARNYIVKRDNYYSIATKGQTALYNSSNTWLRDVPHGSRILISSNSRIICGYSNPSYMSISAWGLELFTPIEPFSSTTFINANLKTSHPSNYYINVRWWD